MYSLWINNYMELYRFNVGDIAYLPNNEKVIILHGFTEPPIATYLVTSIKNGEIFEVDNSFLSLTNHNYELGLELGQQALDNIVRVNSIVLKMTGIVSAESFGTIYNSMTIYPIGITSYEILGTISID